MVTLFSLNIRSNLLVKIITIQPFCMYDAEELQRAEDTPERSGEHR